MSPRTRRLTLGLVVVYVVLLATSHAVRRFSSNPRFDRLGEHVMDLQRVPAPASGKRDVRVTYLDMAPQGVSEAPVVLLVHGTPGRKEHLEALGKTLASRYRVIVPDLPGFGSSTRTVPDYSMRAHAEYLAQLLDCLDVETVHVVGFSFGGGVALRLWDKHPAKVASVSMLASVGVQELELLGDYRLNHALHGLQLALIWLVQEGVPHMGSLDDGMLDLGYARNVYDSDQRPLRAILQRFEPPMLILHGERDPLVPLAAAREHHRIVAHSHLVVLGASHFFPFTRPDESAGHVSAFVERAEHGTAPIRASAGRERRESAAVPFDPGSVPPASGIALVVLMGLIAAATLVSEDLTCIGVGLMVSRGTIAFVPSAVACFVGIFVGDVMLYVAGRYIGRPAIDRVPLRWVLSPERLDLSARWFERRGPVVIFISRFVPGMRLPTYLAAGVLRSRFSSFILWFLLAAALWTPLLVAISAVVGDRSLILFERYGTHAGLALAVSAVMVLVGIRLLTRATTHRGRRLLLARWRRIRHFEFWPPWLLYPPVVAYVVYLGIRFRGLTVFTAANPAMPASGFVGESKGEILEALTRGGAPVARFVTVRNAWGGDRRVREVERFIKDAGLVLPVVVKPDVGQRGDGVVVARDTNTLQRAVRSAGVDVLVQEHVAGDELGVFYYRYPGEEHGRIFSITDKRMPVVIGDGRRTLERLILDDDRAVCMATTYFAAQAERLGDVPGEGECVELVELGTHCRGAIFLDGAALVTPELERTIDEISRGYEGFYFGRYDIRGSAGQLEIIELNGVTSESTDIYDPGNGLIDAYRKLFMQWRIAFEIGALNRAAGARPVGLLALGRMLFRHFRR